MFATFDVACPASPSRGGSAWAGGRDTAGYPSSGSHQLSRGSSTHHSHALRVRQVGEQGQAVVAAAQGSAQQRLQVLERARHSHPGFAGGVPQPQLHRPRARHLRGAPLSLSLSLSLKGLPNNVFKCWNARGTATRVSPAACLNRNSIGHGLVTSGVRQRCKSREP
jgi:hypothetical protein